MTAHENIRRCTIYGARGEARISSISLELPSDPTSDAPLEHARLPRSSRIHRTCADAIQLRDVMSKHLVCGRPDLEISTIVRLMSRHRVGCVPIVDEQRRPIGMITKLDIVEQLDAAMRAHGELPGDLRARVAEDVMMPIALVLDETATVAHAASMMVAEDTHHILVVRGIELVGIVSSKDIVAWLVENDQLFSGREPDLSMSLS
jgi:CBS domain-containing protein